ncbi:YcxB family protein [Streptomyces sp. NPDC005533]|uniref:YcxB family protein n=1 Tax=Streptomyces sp. NPDC005533 TaxID=3364723 RepID=UPI0036A30969
MTAFVMACAVLTPLVTLPRVLTRIAREQYASGDIEWRIFPWYFETDEFFAVKTKNTRGVFVLPKRGAQDPADVDRVRALLDRNLRRI